MARRITFICAALAIFIGVAIFRFHTGANGDNPVPEAFRKPVTDAEVGAMSGKQTLAQPVQTKASIAGKNSIQLAIGGLGTGESAEDGKLADLVLQDLAGTPDIKVVERAEIERILHEQGLSAAGLERAADAVRCGHILGVDWFLLASQFSARGSNYLAARIVDAQNSEIVNAAVLPVRRGLSDTAAVLGNFVRESWRDQSRGTCRTYLGVGAMENLSLGESQSDFAAKLRGYVAEHNRTEGVTVLERDQIEALYRELLLDLAGLTENSLSRRPMLSALCLVSGAYQALDDGKIEVVLEINQITALHDKRLVFRDKPERVLAPISRAIAEQLQRYTNAPTWRRRSEVTAQLELGMSLVQEGHKLPFYETYHRSFFSWDIEDSKLIGTERKLRQYNLTEAIKAFEAALVLDPTNQEAKLCMAECLENPVMNRVGEARELYRQVVDENPSKEWATYSEVRLSETFDGQWPAARAAWYQDAAAKCLNPEAKSYFQKEADRDSKYTTYLEHKNEAGSIATEAFSQAKSNLFANLKRPNYTLSSAVDSFAEAFGTNSAAAAKAATDLLPEMEELYPDRRLELQEAVVAVQVDINAPIVAAFRKKLKELIAHPEAVDHSDDFWSDVRDNLRRWCYCRGCLDVAELIVNQEAEGRAPDGSYLNDQRLVLGLEYYRFHDWTNALRILQTYSNRPVVLHSGLWTRDWLSLFSGTILTEPYVINCEKHLNLIHVPDAREFEVGPAFIQLDQNENFDADEQGVWVGGHSVLRHIRIDGTVDHQFPLPIARDVAVNCVLQDGDCIWLGTRGAGLLKVSKTDGACKHFTMADGLLLNSVRRLARKGDDLWIGYGEDKSGGLGLYSLSSGKWVSFIPTLNINGGSTQLSEDNPIGPPRNAITSLGFDSKGNVLMLIDQIGLRRFVVAKNAWANNDLENGFTSTALASDGSFLARGVSITQFEATVRPDIKNYRDSQARKKLIVASEEEVPSLRAFYATNDPGEKWKVELYRGPLADGGAVQIRSAADGSWRTVRDPQGIPGPPSAMAFAGKQLWVGGNAFLACIDAESGRVVRFAYFNGLVRNLQVGAGSVWVLTERGIFHAASSL